MIKHKGFIKNISGSSIKVSILNESACASCHAQGACTMADVKEKEIDIECHHGNFAPGQEVSVVFRESLGFSALLYGYVLPFILVLSMLIILYALTEDEVVAGLSALGTLIPYYITLYFFRGALKKIFTFELEEISQL